MCAGCNLTVGLGDALEFVLLLDGVRVGRALGSVDELVGEALRDGLDVAERGGARARGQEEDGLVDAAERRDIDGLAADGTGAADTGGVLTGARVDDGVDEDLDRVLAGEKEDDLEGVLEDAERHELLAVVAAVHHHAVEHALDDRALGLAEPLLGVPAGGVRQEDGPGLLDGDVVGERDVADLDVIERPLAEELDLRALDLVLGEVIGLDRAGR